MARLIFAGKTKKHSQKENWRKAKRRNNIQKVWEFTSNAFPLEEIQIQNLKFEALSTLLLCKIKHLPLMYEDKQLSTEVVNLISD